MGDLNSLEASQSVKLAGADSSGGETYFVDATSAGEIKASDVLNSGNGVQAALVIGTTAVELKVGGSPLANRKLVTLYNNSNTTLYWGFTGAVTTLSGTPIVKGQQLAWSVGSSQSIFVIAGSAGNNTRITEA